MNKGLREKTRFLGRVDNKRQARRLAQYISWMRQTRKIGSAAVVGLLGLILLTIAPLYNITNVADSEAATVDCTNNPGDTGLGTNCTLTFSYTNLAASVDVENVSQNGTFATSANNKKAAFSISTNSYNGYTLSVTGSSANTALKTSGNATLNSISSTTGIESSAFSNNTWGYLPSSYRSSNTTIDNNTTKYFQSPSPSFALTMDVTTAANTTAKNYTIGIGAKVNMDEVAGTYNNTNNGNTLSLNYVANPTSYKISYDKGNAAGTPSNMPSKVQFLRRVYH